jgi:hypothetical protein
MGDCPKLEQNFMIFDMVTHTLKPLGMKYDKENRKLYLPRGIDLWFVQKCFEDEYNSVEFEDPNEYKTIDNIKMKYQPRDDIQKECIRFMLGLDEYRENNNYSQLSVNLNTGKGKSYVSIFTMAYTKRKSIVVATIKSWLKQWKDYILEYTNLTSKNVHIISGASSIQMLLTGKSQYNKCDIFLVTHSTIKSFGDQYGWDKVDQLYKILGIGNMFIDEAHLNFDNICNINYSVNVYKTYLVTATPARSDRDENRVYQLSMKNVPGINLFDEDQDPHTRYVAIKWNSKPTPRQVSDCKNMYGLDRNKYVNYVVEQPNFYNMLHIIMDIVMKLDGKTLFYIGTNEAILKVFDWLNFNYPEFMGDIGIYTSISPNKTLEKEKKLILSTTKSAGAAEDIKGLKLTVVLAEPFKSEVLARQTLGRTRDNDTMYIELVDLGFYKIKKYYYEKLPVFNKYATSVSDINMSQIELEERSYDIYRKRERLLDNTPIRYTSSGITDAIYFHDNIDNNALIFYDED